MKKQTDKTKAEAWRADGAKLSGYYWQTRADAIAEALAKAYREAIEVGRGAGRIEEQARLAGLTVGEFARLYSKLKVKR